MWTKSILTFGSMQEQNTQRSTKASGLHLQSCITCLNPAYFWWGFANSSWGTRALPPEHEILGKETQTFPYQKESYGNALLILHSWVIFITGRKCRQQRKKIMDPILQKFPTVSSFQRPEAPTLHFMPWNSLIAIPQLLGSIFPPSPSWGQCYEYRLQHSKLRQAAATDGIRLGKCLVMWTSAFAIWFIAWIKVTSFQAGMHHIQHEIVALLALLFNLKRVKLQRT